MKDLNELFVHMLKDVLYAERAILKNLPKMAKKADSDELRQAFENHVQETEGQVERLEQIFEQLGKAPRAVTCDAMVGLVEEAKSVMEEAKDPDVLDAGILAAAQAVEHYEIARYGTLLAWAKQLGLKDAVPLLEQTLEQEKNADVLLTKLATGKLNKEAAGGRSKAA